jgi:hypothetical protein
MVKVAQALSVDVEGLTGHAGSQNNAVEQLWSLVTSLKQQANTKASNKRMRIDEQ